jgi:RND family efflux transporter MFP subunit
MEIPCVKYFKSSSLLAILILLIGGVATALLVAQDKEGALSAMGSSVHSVDTVVAGKGRYRIQVPAWGFVEPCDAIDIRTEAGGRIARISSSVFAGGRVAKGAHLFSLDARTYQRALAAAMAEHEKARQALVIEQGHQAIAKAEWQLLKQSQWRGEGSKALALREPQLSVCRAEVQIAAARQAQAALDVERTLVKAPCTGVILSESLAPGQVLESGDTVLRLACTERYHITARFPSQYDLDTAAIAGAIADAGADAGAGAGAGTKRGADVSPAGKAEPVVFQIGARQYKARLKAILPQIDPETRQKQALVTFKGQGVTLGSYLELQLPGKRFEDVVVLPKAVLHADDTVWLLSAGGNLEVRRVEVLAEDPHKVVIGKGLVQGERVVTSHIANPLAGLPLRPSTPPADNRREAAVGKEGRQ